jgi:hypothetical protein
MAAGGVGPAGEPAAAERAVGEDAHAEALGGGQYGGLDGAGEDGVAGLLGAERLVAALKGGAGARKRTAALALRQQHAGFAADMTLLRRGQRECWGSRRPYTSRRLIAVALAGKKSRTVACVSYPVSG